MITCPQVETDEMQLTAEPVVSYLTNIQGKSWHPSLLSPTYLTNVLQGKPTYEVKITTYDRAFCQLQGVR